MDKFRKIPIISIIILLLIISSSPIINAYTDNEEGKSGEELPDYVITEIGHGYDVCADGAFYYVVIKNIGNAPGGWDWDVDIVGFEAHLFRPDLEYGKWSTGDNFKIEPGEYHSRRFSYNLWDDHPNFSFVRYECDLVCSFKEKSKDNNHFTKTYWHGLYFLFPMPFVI